MSLSTVIMTLYHVRTACYRGIVSTGPPRTPRGGVEDEVGPAGRSTLREEGRDRARARIVRGAMAAIATSGLDVTVDDVASMAGVSRRTVFRQFRTHSDLVATAVAQMLEDFLARVPGPPAAGEDVEAWLTAASVSLHEAQREIVGRAFWDVHVDRPGTAPEVKAAMGDVAALRRRVTFDLADAAWSELGAQGTPPEWVREAFSLQLSGFATNVLVEHSAQQAGQICARILWTVLCEATRQQREAP